MRLIIEDEEGHKTIVPFGQDAVTIGRESGNTVLLKERNVSRKHASLVRQNGGILIEDLNSFNGVRINGDRIQGRAHVHEGDLIQIGDFDLAIEREATEAPATERRTEPTLPAVRAPGYDVLPSPTPAPDTSPPSASSSAPRKESTAVIKSPYAPGGELNFDGAPVPTADQPRLVLMNTGARGQELAVTKTVVSVGRASGPADLTIDHRSISKLHAKLSLDADGVWHIADLKSANGMRINGEDYGDAPLSPGDLIELGHVQIKFVPAGQRSGVKKAASAGGRRVMGTSVVVGASLVAVVGLGLAVLRHPKDGQRPEDVPPPPRAQQALAPLPAIANPAPTPPPALPPLPPTTPPPPTEPSEESAAAETERASQALQQAKVFAKARRWDKADEKLREAEQVDADDPTVVRLRHDIDAARDKEAVKEPLKVAHADRKPKAHAAEAAPEPESPPPPAAAPTSKGDRHGKAKAVYEEAIAAIGGQDYVGALAKLERAADLDPGLAEAQKGMGICYAKLHQPDKGAYHYEQYLKLSPHARDADDVRKMLQDYYKTRGE